MRAGVTTTIPCAWALNSPFQSGAEATALQMLARGSMTQTVVERLECGRFIAALSTIP